MDAIEAVSRLLDIQDRMSLLDDEAKAIKAWLSGELGEGKHRVGPVTYSIYRSTRFSTRRAADVLPENWLALVSRPSIDAKIARDVLPPELYSACQETTSTTVRLT